MKTNSASPTTSYLDLSEGRIGYWCVRELSSGFRETNK